MSLFFTLDLIWWRVDGSSVDVSVCHVRALVTEGFGSVRYRLVDTPKSDFDDFDHSDRFQTDKTKKVHWNRRTNVPRYEKEVFSSVLL